MRFVALITAVFTFALVASAFQDAEQPPPPAKPDANHQWLNQMVGDWTIKSEFIMAPGDEPMRMEGTETVRSLGNLWTIAEGHAEMSGTPLTWVLTLGYDARKKAFVGSWVDSTASHLWTYTGTLDESKKVLTLDTEGPSFTDPTKDSKFRETLEVKSADHRTFTSSILGDDGKWITFVRSDYRRKDKK